MEKLSVRYSTISRVLLNKTINRKRRFRFINTLSPNVLVMAVSTCLIIRLTEFLLFLIGDAGNSLSYHNTMKFSTWDSDNDKSGGKCAVNWKGGWWYKSCAYVNLNGLYLGAGKDHYTGNHWRGWTKYSLKKVEMKIRPSQL